MNRAREDTTMSKKTKTIAQAGFALGQERGARLAAERENAQLRTQLQQRAAPPPASQDAPPAAPPPPPPAPAPKALHEMSRAEIEAATPASADPHATKRNALGRALALRERGQALLGGKR